MKRFDLTFPVRTRGGLASADKTGSEAKPVRGAVRTSGSPARVVPVPPVPDVRGPESLHELFSALRERVEDLPLVIMVFGWCPSSVADRFGAELVEVLSAEDRVWWVRMPNTATTDLGPQPGVMLDSASTLDLQILRNQPAEVVFLSGEPAMADAEKAHLDATSGMPVVMLMPDNPEGRRLAALALEHGRRQFSINGSTATWISICPDRLFA